MKIVLECYINIVYYFIKGLIKIKWTTMIVYYTKQTNKISFFSITSPSAIRLRKVCHDKKKCIKRLIRKFATQSYCDNRQIYSSLRAFNRHLRSIDFLTSD